MGAEQAPNVIRALFARALAAVTKAAPEAETAAAPRAAPAAAGVVADDVVAATGTNAGRNFIRNWFGPRPAAPEAVPAAPAAPAPAAPTPAAPAAPASPASATFAPATETPPSALRRFFSRDGWEGPRRAAFRQAKIATALGALGLGTYGALQVDDAVRNPVQTPEQKRLQKALDAQQTLATDDFARPGNRQARRDGSTEITGPLPAARDRLESSVPRTNGVLTNFTAYGAPVRAINEGGVRKLEWDYSALGMGPGDSVTFDPSMNARQVAPNVYRTDDPGPRATSAKATLTYSGVTRDDTVELNAGALANRHRVAVTAPPVP